MPVNFRTRCILAAKRTLAIACLCSAPTYIGCSGRTPPPDISDLPYPGPPLTFESSDGRHVILAEPPSPGWTIRLDRVMDGYGFQSAYVSVLQPNPAFSYPPVTVQQHVSTPVHASEPLKLFARELDFQGKSANGYGYSRVTLAEIATPAPPATPTTPTTPPAPPTPRGNP